MTLGAMSSLALPSLLRSQITSGTAQASGTNNIIHYYFHDFGNLSVLILERAVKIMLDNIFSPFILEEAYRIASRWCMQDGYWKACKMNLQSHYTPWDLLSYQIKTLSVQSVLPDLHFYGMNKKSDIMGQGELGCVKIIWVDPNWVRIKGHFKVQINRRQFMYSTDPLEWAAVIVHEMLHNLGHAHPDNDYRLDFQIMAFEQAMYYSADTSIYGPLPSAWGGY